MKNVTLLRSLLPRTSARSTVLALIRNSLCSEPLFLRCYPAVRFAVTPLFYPLQTRQRARVSEAEKMSLAVNAREEQPKQRRERADQFGWGR
jgi:hypothetical protein